jgi:hypothetical protein
MKKQSNQQELSILTLSKTGILNSGFIISFFKGLDSNFRH